MSEAAEKKEVTEDGIEFWSVCEDAEELYHTSIGDALDAYAEDNFLSGEEMPKTVEVYGFVRQSKPSVDGLLKWNPVLEEFVERLDEEYGPMDDFTEITPAMRAAERVFVEAVLAEYSVWRCEMVLKMTVNTADYLS
jgi:hypothetical protein